MKTGENVRKNAEMRTSPVALPPDYDNTLRCSGRDEFLAAKTIHEQVEVIKRLSIKPFSNEDPDLLEFLIDLYFLSPMKHPVRNQISR